MALPLLRSMGPGSRRILALVMTAVVSVMVALLLMPTSSLLAFSVIAGLWLVYAVIRVVVLMRRATGMAGAADNTNNAVPRYLDRDKETQLGGRAELTAALGREIARSRRHGDRSALYVLDTRIVNFRPSKPGEKAPSPARYVAEVLVEQGRGTDMVCRVDLTRFAVVLADANSEGAGLYEERIRTALSASPYATNNDGTGIWVRGWGGWAAWDESMTRPVHFLMAAMANMEEQRQLYESDQIAFGGSALAS